MTTQNKPKIDYYNYEILTESNIVRSSYIFNESMERVFLFTTSITHYKQIYKSIISDIICLKGNPEAFTIGSEYKFKYKNEHSVRLLIEDKIETPDYKSVLIYYYDIQPSEFRYKLNLKFYKDTVEKRFTYYTYDFMFSSPQSFKFYEANFNARELKKLLIEMDEYFHSNSEGLEQVESIVLNTSMKKVWDIITDWKVFQKHVPIIASRIEYERNCEGEIALIKLYYDNDKTEYYLKVKRLCLKNYVGEFSLLLFTSSKSFPSQEFHFNVIEINTNRCMLIFKHVFLKYVNSQMIEELSINKKEILNILRKSLSE
jgi:hypothetical protein